MRTVLAARASTILFRLARASPPGVFLLPANVCPIVPMTLMLATRPFEHVDLDPRTLAMSSALLLERQADRSQQAVVGVIYVRTYGAMSDVADLFSELQGSGAMVIDDRCLAEPEPELDALDSQGADAILFSTGLSKPVDLGIGGFAHLRDALPYRETTRTYQPRDLRSATALYKLHIESQEPLPKDAWARLRYLQWLDTNDPPMHWSEYRQRILEKRPRAGLHRQRLNAIYESYLDRNVQLGPEYNGWRFQVRLSDRDNALKAIFAAGHFASAHYFPSSVLFSKSDSTCPVANTLAGEVLNLFNDERIDEEEAAVVARIVANHLDRDCSRS